MAIDWSVVTADHIKEACRRLDKGEVTCRHAARNTFINFHDRNYPAKFVRGLAYKIATGYELNPNTDFSGGRETASFLRKLGFKVEYEPSKISSIIPAQRSPPRNQLGDSREVMGGVNLGVRQQKEALQRVLQTQFHKVKVNQGFDWLVVPETVPGIGPIGNVRERLVSHRGFDNFSTSGRALRCDFYIPKQKLIIEYDERQHFTEARALSLEAYPSGVPLGFERQKWLAACRAISASDNDPPYRDEQRAFYDSIRDILSCQNGFLLIRIKHGDWDWNRSESAKYLLDMLSRSARCHNALFGITEPKWRIEARYEQQPKLGRLIIADSWEGDAKTARDLLWQVGTQWPAHIRLDCFVTCGAFLRFAWPRNMSVTQGYLNPDPADIATLENGAERVVRDLLDDELVGTLRRLTRYLTLGVDSPLQNKITTTSNRITPPHIEFVCVVDLKAQPFRLHWTGKSYPTTNQAGKLVRIPDLKTHFLTLESVGDVMILGCHDLTMFSPRARKTAKGWRRNTWKSFEEIYGKEKPILVLHHPHTTVKTKTWGQAWGVLRHVLPSVKMYVGAGRYQEDWRQRADYDALDAVLSRTKLGPTLDFVAYPG